MTKNIRAIKVRIYPTEEQKDFLNQQFGAVRFVYNKGIVIKKNRYRFHGENLSPKRDIRKLLKVARKSRKYHWLAKYDYGCLADSLIDLDRTFTKFFKKQAGYPKFRNRYGKQSSLHRGSDGRVAYGKDWIKIPKMKPIKAKIHRDLNDSRVTSITITRSTTGKYYASMLFKDNIDKKVEKIQEVQESKVIGLDLGLTHILVDSNGNKIANPRFIKRATRNLRTKQKKLSRKKKGSNSRAKAKLLVAKCHEKVTNARNDFQHKLSKMIVDENQAIIVETLKTKNMMKNKSLAKHIGDASWSSLTEKLKYKAADAGKHFKKISPNYASSKTCSKCGFKMDGMGLKIRKWSCINCGAKHDRDINAAINIRHQGLIFLKANKLVASAN